MHTMTSSNSPALDIHPIKAPVPIPNLWLWIACAVGLLLLAALLWRAWRKRRQQMNAPKPEPVIPSHQKARTQLQAALALLDQPRPFCILVSDTIRTYLEERFDLRAPERTTEEFLEELQASPMLNYDQKRTLGEFLTACDLVKFARYEPGRSELQGLYDAAVRLVDETQMPEAVPADAAASSAPSS
jgi:hypothetical protein